MQLNYVLWDSAQQPMYEACAADFTKTHPNITVKITQSGWGDYWSSIQTGMVAGNAPDVFTDPLWRMVVRRLSPRRRTTHLPGNALSCANPSLDGFAYLNQCTYTSSNGTDP
ncbi:extracellular solute-binding protein [Candidatus Amarolinea aalborgensis]|uniref:extracellular solute-binding protein n=1 Tax=Candidatus Amarolinea aalborgensis TaxID=2249329 RepID=UPI003BF9F3AC